MTIQHLVHMANQVTAFFASGLSHVALEAVKRIAQKDAAKKSA